MAKKILTVVITVLLLAGILFGICYFVGRRAEAEDRKLSVQYNGKVVNDLKGLVTTYSVPLVFKVTGEDYTVRIVPVEGVQFAYLIDGQAYKLTDLKDLTAGFTIDTAEDGTVTIKPCGSLETVLSVVTGKAVTLPDGSNTEQDLFTVIFAQDDTEFRASFSFYKTDVQGIELSEEGMVF